MLGDMVRKLVFVVDANAMQEIAGAYAARNGIKR